MKINEQPMSFNERLAETSFFNEHWILFSILLCSIIFICTLIIIIIYYIQKEYKDNIINFIPIAGIILSFMGLLILLISTWMVYSNNDNMKYINYNMTGTVENVSTLYNNKQNVTVTSDIDKYHILLPPTVNVKKGDMIKISSNGNIITDNDHDQAYINVSTYSKDHNINVKIKQNNTWYPIKAQVYDDFIR